MTATTTPEPPATGRPVLLVLCTRVGHASGIPPGSSVADCSLCGSAVWLTPIVAELAEGFGLEVVAVCDDQAGHVAEFS